jgi:hypothetical protein
LEELLGLDDVGKEPLRNDVVTVVEAQNHPVPVVEGPPKLGTERRNFILSRFRQSKYLAAHLPCHGASLAEQGCVYLHNDRKPVSTDGAGAPRLLVPSRPSRSRFHYAPLDKHALEGHRCDPRGRSIS